MKTTGVRYSALVNTGNYENEKIELEAALEEGDSVEGAVAALKVQVFDLLDKPEKLERRNEIRREIAQLEGQLSDAREQWERTAEFLKAQGLRPDAPDFPAAVFRSRKAIRPAEHVEVLMVDPLDNAEPADVHPDHR